MKTEKNTLIAAIIVAAIVFFAIMVFISESSILKNKYNSNIQAVNSFFTPFPIISKHPTIPEEIPQRIAKYIYDCNIYTIFIKEKSYTTYIEKKLVYEPSSKKHILHIIVQKQKETSPKLSKPIYSKKLKENTVLQCFSMHYKQEYQGAMPSKCCFYRLLSQSKQILWEGVRYGDTIYENPIWDIKKLSADTWLLVTNSAPNALYINTTDKTTTAYYALPRAGKAPDIRYLRITKAEIKDNNTIKFYCPDSTQLKIRIKQDYDNIQKNITDKHDMDRQTIWWNGIEPAANDIFSGKRLYGKISVRDTASWDCHIDKKTVINTNTPQ